ncbi:alginate lyase family protein [Winogradskyella sp. R77965]|uniref:alginate lyase family protein n=1 Tax=Winogradskyella sp. R77965 TaxID=3093872 RepID=UPI0037DCCC5D
MKHFKFIIFLLSIVFNCTDQPTDFEMVSELEGEYILNEAKKYSNLKPITVTSYISKRSAGGIHDFYSEGDYWWPNPKHPDSAYIRKDGLTNPDNFTAHRLAMIRLSRISGSLASAYLVTENEKYIEDLIPHLKAWFINDATKMNPNLMFAQAIKGRVTGRGIGIIDTIHLIEVSKAIGVVETSGLMQESDLILVKEWFKDYLAWLTSHSYGKKERDNGNNHSTCWAMQVAAFAELTQNETQLEWCRDFFKNTLLPEQMAEDGGFPKELSRTKPYGYSIFNLDAFCGVAQILSTDKDDLFKFETKDGKSLVSGLNFMTRYIRNKDDWPYQKDVMYWEDWPTKQSSVLFGALAYDDESYLKLWKSLPQIPEKQEIIRNMPIKYPLLWIKK